MIKGVDDVLEALVFCIFEDGDTPFMRAVGRGDAETLRLLAALGLERFDLHREDFHGCTAAHLLELEDVEAKALKSAFGQGRRVWNEYVSLFSGILSPPLVYTTDSTREADGAFLLPVTLTQLVISYIALPALPWPPSLSALFRPLLKQDANLN